MISKHLICVFVILSTTALSLRLEKEEVHSFLQSEVASEQGSKTLYYVTKNQKKVEELTKIIGDTLKAKDVQLSNVTFDVEATKGKVEEVAISKAKSAVAKAAGPVLVEAVELSFEALPEVSGSKLKNEEILAKLEPFENKNAKATSVFVYFKSADSQPQVFVGETKGKIVEPRGSGGLGWDPIFLPDGYDKTYAELDIETKNKISQRKLALDKFVEYVNSTPDWI